VPRTQPSVEERLEQLLEARRFPPPPDFAAHAQVRDQPVYEQAAKDAPAWWADQARQRLDWQTPFSSVLDDGNPPFYSWFADGRLNASYNCLDRHVEAGHGDRVAFHWRGEEGEERDLTWCTADVGWITGHSYIVYGPMACGATSVMFEGAPGYPDRDIWWEIAERCRVSVFYTAPTAIRAAMKWGAEYPGRHDLSSLRLLGSVGEPINPKAWLWYHVVIGGERCPIVDTWWQTETGAIMISPLPGITPAKPGSATLPLPGVSAALFDEDGIEIARPKRNIWADDLPKTRSGKIMRRLLRDIAEGREPGDATTLGDPSVLDRLQKATQEST
jgi:acyl-coenzyme A synthetase/AMP-(fatty) acid ligase